MSNNILWTGADIAAAVEGRWVAGLEEDVFASGVCYYPQQVIQGDLVFAINPKTWGNGYKKHVASLEQLANSGAAAVIIDRQQLSLPHPSKLPLLLVEDTRQALEDLGRAARGRFKGKVICVTGSVGKSSVKEGLRHALAAQLPTYGSRKNFNHGPGVPLCLAQTSPDLNYGVYEFSMDMPNITLRKAKIARPDVAIITNIHPDHLLHYPSVEAVADQKSLLVDGCGRDGVVVLNRDDPLFERLKNNVARKNIKRLITFGEHTASDVCLIKCELHEERSYITAVIDGKKYEYVMGLPGKHMVFNSLAILAGIKAVGADINRAVASLASLQPIQSHLVYHKVNHQRGFFHLIDDTYNANVASIRAALEYLSLFKLGSAGRRIVVLGELSELGPSSETVHASLANSVISANIEKVYTVGEGMKHLRAVLPENMLGAHAEVGLDLIDELKKEIRSGDVLLLTGTRTKSLNAKEHLIHVANALKTMNIEVNISKNDNTKNNKVVQIEHRKHATRTSGSSIIFVGDTSFGENYQEKIKNTGGENLLEKKGYEYSLQKMKKFLCDADLVIANLETPLTNLKTSPFTNIKKYVHWSDIEKTPKALLQHNIGAVSLANNHTLDFGGEGFYQTLSTLEKYNIPYFGAGNNIQDASVPLIVQIGSGSSKTILAIFGAFEERKTYRQRYKVYAEGKREGVQPLDIDAIIKSIQATKNEFPEAFIIVFPHWGENYQQPANQTQKQLAENLVQAGANLILGHGPHLLQEITKKNNCWIAYSLGNFVFNSPGRYARMKAPPFSMVSKLIIDDQHRDIKLRFYPIVTDNKLTQYQERFVDQNEFGKVCELLNNEFFAEVIKGCDDYGHFLELHMPQSKINSVWFEDIRSVLVLSKDNEELVMQKIWQSIQHRKLLIEELPSHLKNDIEPRIVFISASDAMSSAKIVIGLGNGIIAAISTALTKLFSKFNPNERIKWLKVDIVQNVRDLLEGDFAWERALFGVATEAKIGIALLAEQLVMNKRIDEKQHRYVFNTLSLFTDGNTTIQLYRGNKAEVDCDCRTLLSSAKQAGQYLVNAVDSKGKFTYLYWPKRDKVPDGYNILRHAGSTYALLELYQITNEEIVLKAATRALHYLQKQMHYLNLQGEKVACVVEEGCVKLGGNGLAILAFAKYMEITQDYSLLEPAQYLAKWIQKSQRENGEFAIHKQSFPEQKLISFLSEYYPGEAMFALLRLYHLDKQTCWIDVAEKGSQFIINIRDRDLSLKQLAHDHWFIYALNELYRLRPHSLYRDQAFRIAETIMQKQNVKSRYPDWVGCFNNPPRSTPAATRSEGLCAAYQLAQYCGYAEHAERIRESAVRAIRFQLHTQFQPESAIYLKNPLRALGGFRESLENFELRIDYSQHNISSLLLLYKILSAESSRLEEVMKTTETQ